MRATSLISLMMSLGLGIVRGRLAGEDLDARHPILVRLGAHRVIERDRLEYVQELALVFVDALDLDVEHRSRVDLHSGLFRDHGGEPLLVGAFHGEETFLESGIVGEWGKPGKLLDIVQDALAEHLGQERGQTRDWLRTASGAA